MCYVKMVFETSFATLVWILRFTIYALSSVHGWKTYEFLEGSTVGKKYRASAKLGRNCINLTEEDLTDPSQYMH
ncbi:unnamed protein product [Penicillium salamii]|nr:unnamed protein product [Penicillium salamii]CAG8303420.1 unnamed protein product [Penicillium salamii]